MAEHPKLGTKEYLEEIQSALHKSIVLISNSLKDLPAIKDDVSMAFSLMTGPIIESSHSMLILSQYGKLRDCYALSRMIFDLALNLGYFGVKGEESVKLALQHYHQKSFRDLDREIEIKGVKFGIKLDNKDNVTTNEKLKEALDYFTSKKGFEIRSWTGDNTFKKIELIIEKYGKDLGFMFIINLFFTYRHSSEIIHGTLFGSLFARGLTKPELEQPNTEDEMQNYETTYISFNLICVLLLHYSIFKIIDIHYPRNSELENLRQIIRDFKITLFEN